MHMKILSTLFISGLLIGNFLSAPIADAAMDHKPVKSLMRISKRTLDRQVRAGWRHVQTTTKGF